MEKSIKNWCQTQAIPQGQLLTLNQVWHLSQLWYSDRLSSEYTGRSVEQIQQIFQQVGLSGSFWQL